MMFSEVANVHGMPEKCSDASETEAVAFREG